MTQRRNLYVAGSIAASLAYIFVSLSFTGAFNVVRWAVFMAVFLVVFYAFDRLIDWTVAE